MSSNRDPRVTVPEDPTRLTKQAPRDGTSVEEQLRSYQRAGLVPSSGRQPRYGDFTGIGDFHECLQRVTEARDQFQQLPATVRALASNDPGIFLEMLYGGKREFLEQLERAGLLEIQKPPAAMVSEPVEPAKEVKPKAPAKGSEAS